jgi:hypothetical protein
VGNDRTDWDTYYAEISATSRLTRRITERKLLAVIARFSDPAERLDVCELGGANSCFADKLLTALPIRSYHIVDTNERGLSLLDKRFGAGGPVTWERADVLKLKSGGKGRYDLVYSVGLIEHFDEMDTRRSIEAHFDYARGGGLVVMTFPTPTWLYRSIRTLLEATKNWAFPDERPLLFDEVIATVKRRGEILYESINWPILLTQGIIAARAYSRGRPATESPERKAEV